jgi:hypothetical protein
VVVESFALAGGSQTKLRQGPAGSAGLGLAVTRKFARMMVSEVTAASRAMVRFFRGAPKGRCGSQKLPKGRCPRSVRSTPLPIFRMLGIFAEFERSMIKERVRAEQWCHFFMVRTGGPKVRHTRDPGSPTSNIRP